jgi:protein-S-isoprenylcysteine O-methyltransferase Ste14
MNKKQNQDHPAMRVPPPLIPLCTLLAGFGLSKLWPIDLGLKSLRPFFSSFGLTVIVLAIALGFWAIWALRSAGEKEWPWTPTGGIVGHGPFRFSRNPIYLQMVLICLGFGLRRMDPWTLLMTPLTAWLLSALAIRPEEDYLESKFGDAYLAYKNEVRRWF